MKFALIGNPNSGKTLLFNTLTHQKAAVANYAGVTIEKNEAVCSFLPATILDLPGIYTLEGKSLDEKITQDVVHSGIIDVFIVVCDILDVARGLNLFFELCAFQKPIVVVLNRIDLIDPIHSIIDQNGLEKELKCPVVLSSSFQKHGTDALKKCMRNMEQGLSLVELSSQRFSFTQRLQKTHQLVQQYARVVTKSQWTQRIDHFLLHPICGTLTVIFFTVLICQCLFNWSEIPMQWIEHWVFLLQQKVQGFLIEDSLKSLIVYGILGSVGSVLVFIPQILILFSIIYILDDSGVLPRLAFLMNGFMRMIGLNGKAFMPFLSSFACAVPGILSTRTIRNKTERIVTILVLPMIPCSAKLPVYSLMIAAFIPNQVLFSLAGFHVKLRGIVLVGLYALGICSAMIAAWVFRKTLFQGQYEPTFIDLPIYQLPRLKNWFFYILERLKMFLSQAGTLILCASILLWFLASYPRYAGQTNIFNSFAGKIGLFLEPIFRPIGFNWKIVVALIPGFAAREVLISSLATVYSLDASFGTSISDALAKDLGIAGGLSLMIFYVFACQCASTLAVVKKETNSFKYPILLFGVMSGLAYFASLITYRLALKWA